MKVWSKGVWPDIVHFHDGLGFEVPMNWWKFWFIEHPSIKATSIAHVFARYEPNTLAGHYVFHTAFVVVAVDRGLLIYRWGFNPNTMGPPELRDGERIRVIVIN